MKNSTKVFLLRSFHGLATLYFLFCVGYLYYGVFTQQYDVLLAVCMASLLAEAIVVYGFNKGDCPLIHIQRRIGDETPFFALFLPDKIAKLVIPVVSVITLIGVGLLVFGMMKV